VAEAAARSAGRRGGVGGRRRCCASICTFVLSKLSACGQEGEEVSEEELAVDVLLSRMTHAGVVNPKAGVANPKAGELHEEVADIVMRIDGSIVGMHICMYVCIYRSTAA
jgi:hypothetical protein